MDTDFTPSSRCSIESSCRVEKCVGRFRWNTENDYSYEPWRISGDRFDVCEIFHCAMERPLMIVTSHFVLFKAKIKAKQRKALNYAAKSFQRNVSLRYPNYATYNAPHTSFKYPARAHFSIHTKMKMSSVCSLIQSQ